MSPPSPRRVLVESVPIAGVMLFWLAISWLGSHPLLGSGARAAGVVMALTYAVVRGVTLADPTGPTPAFSDLPSVLRVNALALLGAAAWFVTARLVLAAGQFWRELGLPGAFTSPAEGLAFAFTVTGVVTVVMYAVAFGTTVLRGEGRRGSQPTATGSPADD